MTISRRHLTINRNGYIATDLRSLNGTAVNGKVLSYDRGLKLSDGDMITLATSEVLRFNTAGSKQRIYPKPEGWAVFINGDDKTYQFLSEPEYFLSRKGRGLVLQPGFSQSALLRLRNQVNKQVYIVENEWKVRVMIINPDGRYQDYFLRENQWIDAIGAPSTYVRLTSDKKLAEEGPSFQIILRR
jgi:pSer/pThr/pTyr-binding forkhead associated (FHA) protein